MRSAPITYRTLPVSLKSVHSGELRSLAEKIAAGDLTSFDRTFADPALGSGEIIHASLVHGFGAVMLYGGICVWVLAALSFMTFGAKRESASRLAIE